MTSSHDPITRATEILLVDDETASLQLLAAILAKEGYKVRPADGPRVAIESALAHPPSLILLDVRMPEMSGFEVCRRLKQDERTRTIPIIFVSALHDTQDRVQGFGAGGVDFVSKPFQESEVLARVRTHLQLHHMRLYLEDLVSQRTAELTEANEALRAEIAERKQVEEALRESEDKYRTLVEQAQDGVVVVQDGRIQFANSYVAELAGYRPEELLDTLFGEHIAADERSRIIDFYTRRRNGEAVPAVYQSAIRHRDGSRVAVEFNAGASSYGGKPAVLVIVRDITERKRAEQELQQYQRRLQKLASQLTLTEERERRRIAAELHDEVGQTLAFARMRLASASKATSDDKVTAILDDVSQSLRQAIDDTRDLVFDLSSPLMNEIGLAAAISEWLEEQVGRKHGLQTEFFNDGHRIPLDDDMRAMLFRAVRELLMNVVKHAQAKQVTVSLESEGPLVRIVVQDDGVGFHPETIPETVEREGGFGLFSIRERMADLDGSLDIVSEPGKGCQAILTAPTTIPTASA